MNPFGQGVLLDGSSDQFRLSRIQTFNWGTFSNVFDFPIPKEGYLFVGKSGSGKSTVLDAHAALLTPPKWVDFNVAAREAEKSGKDRNLMTYVRGAWAQQTGDDGEHVYQYLRTGTTWSAIVETYRNEQGRVVTLVLILTVRGNSTAPNDVHKHYLTLERELSIQELDFFPRHEFDARRFKTDLPDAAVHANFSAYQERFCRLLGIDNERALRLLHKTQSAKNLGDLNVFLRDFMLDAPTTFDIAQRLVDEFGELNSAHQTVVAARQQVDVLIPAQVEHEEMEAAARSLNVMQEVSAGVDHYRERRRREMLDAAIAEEEVELEGSRQKALQLEEQAEAELVKLTELRQQRAGMGGAALEQLQRELAQAEAEKPVRLKRRETAQAACLAMGWAMPDDVVWFVQRVDAARHVVLKAGDARREWEQKKDELKSELRRTEEEFVTTVTEVRAMERQRSNIPARLLGVRERLAADLGVAEDKLPFVGELLEVRQDAAAWQGAIERVLGGFARSILVDDRNYAAVSAYLNDHHLGERLAYFRVMSQTSGNTNIGPNSLVRKLNVAQVEHGDWLREELKTNFDFECADSLQAFRAARRAVTVKGQVKHNTIRHEKNDRDNIDDRSRWVLGFDNAAKLALFQEKAARLGARIGELKEELKAASAAEDRFSDQVLHCQNLSNLSWSEVDVASLLARVTDLTNRIEKEKEAHPNLALIDAAIQAQEKVHREAGAKKNRQDAHTETVKSKIRTLSDRKTQSEREHTLVAETPTQTEALDSRYAKHVVTLETLDAATVQVVRGINAEVRALEATIADLRNRIVQRFAEFNRRWPAESGGLDAVLASAPDYFGKLTRLQTDRLPQFEDRFFGLLRDQSDQNLSRLQHTLANERAEIRNRMELVNESLAGAPFNPGTYLVIETMDRYLPDVAAFKAGLKDALSHSFSTDRDVAEQRFKVLAALVDKLKSQETADRNWRNLVLDVRQHVEFVARELDAAGIEVEVYRSGAGKSGGQRQKLTATCLAAALRYQLGGQDRALPSFSTVVLDEAFDKADSEFTAMAMNIFKTFGFQTIIATPMKSVMTLEPFIGGACYVHIKDRKKSTVITIDYDTDTRRLKWSNVALPNAEEAAVD